MAGTWLRPLLSPPAPGQLSKEGVKNSPRAGASPRHQGWGFPGVAVPDPAPRARPDGITREPAALLGAGGQLRGRAPSPPSPPAAPWLPTPARHPHPCPSPPFLVLDRPPDEGWTVAGLRSPGVGEEHPAPTVGAGTTGTHLPRHRRGWKRQGRFVPSAGWKPARGLLEGSQHSPGRGRRCRSPCQGPAARANGSGDALAKWPAPRGAPGGLRAAQAARHQAWGAPRCWGGVGGPWLRVLLGPPPAAHGS